MIEVNLLPGSVKASRGLPKLKFGGGGGAASKLKLPAMDKTIAMIVGGWILAVLIVAYLHFTTGSEITRVAEELTLAQEEEKRLADVQTRLDTMRAQEAVISKKLEVIQEIDAGRYTYPHILDELSRTLPPYVWLINVTEAFTEGSNPRVKIEGRAGNYFALGRYIEQLENSPFIEQVRLVSSARTQVQERIVYGFVIELGYQTPPADAIQTVPLFTARPEGEGN